MNAEQRDFVTTLMDTLHLNKVCSNEISHFYLKLLKILGGNIRKHLLFFACDWCLRFYGIPTSVFRHYFPKQSLRAFPKILKLFLRRRIDLIEPDEIMDYDLFQISSTNFELQNSYIDHMLYLSGVDNRRERILLGKYVLKVRNHTSYRLTTIILSVLEFYYKKVCQDVATIFGVKRLSSNRARSCIERILKD